jgi:hypothetical protein
MKTLASSSIINIGSAEDLTECGVMSGKLYLGKNGGTLTVRQNFTGANSNKTGFDSYGTGITIAGNTSTGGINIEENKGYIQIKQNGGNIKVLDSGDVSRLTLQNNIGAFGEQGFVTSSVRK